MTDLYDAAEAGDLARVCVLVEQGADKNKEYNLGTPLHIASARGHLTVVQYLVELGADMEKVRLYDWTPLLDASAMGHLEVVRYLIEQGAKRDKATDSGNTSLHWAARYGHLEVAKLLMVYGADLNATNWYGRLPIDLAANEEIRQAIRDEPERRWDQQPRKRCIGEDRHLNAAASASAQQEEDEENEEDKQTVEANERMGTMAGEDQNSDPSSDEEGS